MKFKSALSALLAFLLTAAIPHQAAESHLDPPGNPRLLIDVEVKSVTVYGNLDGLDADFELVLSVNVNHEGHEAVSAQRQADLDTDVTRTWNVARPLIYRHEECSPLNPLALGAHLLEVDSDLEAAGWSTLASTVAGYVAAGAVSGSIAPGAGTVGGALAGALVGAVVGILGSLNGNDDLGIGARAVNAPGEYTINLRGPDGSADVVFEVKATPQVRSFGIPDCERDVRPIQAVFNPATQSTQYALHAVGLPGERVVFLPPGGANCGDIQAFPSSSDWTWHHPHPPCDRTTTHADVTLSRIVQFIDASRGVVAAYVCTYQGAESGTGPPCSQIAMSPGPQPPADMAIDHGHGSTYQALTARPLALSSGQPGPSMAESLYGQLEEVLAAVPALRIEPSNPAGLTSEDLAKTQATVRSLVLGLARIFARTALVGANGYRTSDMEQAVDLYRSARASDLAQEPERALAEYKAAFAAAERAWASAEAGTPLSLEPELIVLPSVFSTRQGREPSFLVSTWGTIGPTELSVGGLEPERISTVPIEGSDGRGWVVAISTLDLAGDYELGWTATSGDWSESITSSLSVAIPTSGP